MKCVAEVGPGGYDLIGFSRSVRRESIKELAIYPEGQLPPCYQELMDNLQRGFPLISTVRANLYHPPEFVSKVTAVAGPVDMFGIFNVTNDPVGEDYQPNRGAFTQSVKGVLAVGGLVIVSEQYSDLHDDQINIIRRDLTLAGFETVNYIDDLWRSMATMGLRHSDEISSRIMSILRSDDYSFDRFAVARKVTN